MRYASLLPALVIGTAAVSNLAKAAETNWRPMAYASLQEPSASDPLQTVVWPDVIREANAYVTTELKRPLNGRNARVTALSSTYQDDGRTVIVSIALSRQCDSGANDKGAGIQPSTCPARIAVLVGGKLLSMKTVSACYVDHADADLPAVDRNDDTFTAFDQVSGTVTFRTVIAGKLVPSCTRTESIK